MIFVHNKLCLSNTFLKLNRLLFNKNVQQICINNTNRMITSSLIYNNQKQADTADLNISKLNNLPTTVQVSIFQKLKESFGFQGGLRQPTPVLTLSSMRLYMCIQYQVDFDKFFKRLDAPDVMYSYCLINFLHVWMISVVLMQYGRSGLFVRKLLHENMWKDIEQRSRKLKAPMNKSSKYKTYDHLNDTFRTFLFGLDEGLLSDDTILAAAIWRHLLEQKEIKDFALLGELCDYIRKNIHHLETQVSEIDVLKNGIVSFVDLDAKELDHSKVRAKILEKISKREHEE